MLCINLKKTSLNKIFRHKYYLVQVNFGLVFHPNLPYSIGSGCPFPRSEKVTIASAIATPIAAPYAAIPASAMK